MKKLNLLLIGAALMVPALAQAAINKGIENSPHDFSTNSWALQYGSHRVCEVCHAVHHTDTKQIAPLWAHATTTTTFTPYDNTAGTQNSTPGQPGGVSRACLSCHDGSLAVNQLIGGSFVGGVSSGPIDSQYIIPEGGTDLHNTHPISITYDANLATTDGALENPTTYHIGDPKTALTYQTAPVPAGGFTGIDISGKTINQAMLFNGKVECASCHDVHKQDGSAPSSGIMARISGDDSGGKGSLLCRTCHIK